MTEKRGMSYSEIKGATAKELIDLSHQELDSFIEQAKTISSNASMIVTWLTAIKFEKSLRENGRDGGSE